VWNALHQLSAIHFADGTTTSYRYDPLGRRIEINAAGRITRYAYDGDNIVLEYDGSNNRQASYTDGLGTDSALEMSRGGKFYYYVQDGQNSISAVTDSAGTVTNSYTYDAFGNQTASTGTIANPFTYTGREYDPKSGLYYNRSRYYDPGSGRFLSEDPALDANAYPYANSNPTNLIDPNGAEAEVESALLNYYTDALKRGMAIQRLNGCIAGQLLWAVLAMGGQAVTPPDEGGLVAGAFQDWFLSFLPDKLQGATRRVLNPDDLGQANPVDRITGKIKDKVRNKVEGKLFDITGLPEGSQDFVNSLKDAYDYDKSVRDASDAAGAGNTHAVCKALQGLCKGG
jgi:RHS repeat-associated protein